MIPDYRIPGRTQDEQVNRMFRYVQDALNRITAGTQTVSTNVTVVAGSASGADADTTKTFAQTASATVANTTTETTLTAAGSGSLTVGAGRILEGTTVVIEAAGTFICNAAGTLTFKLKLTDETPTTVTMATTASVDLADSANTRGWMARFLLTGRTAGASGTVWAHGHVTLSDATNTDVDAHLQAGQTNTVDTTDENDIDLTATWSAADAALTITCTTLNIYVEQSP